MALHANRQKDSQTDTQTIQYLDAPADFSSWEHKNYERTTLTLLDTTYSLVLFYHFGTTECLTFYQAKHDCRHVKQNVRNTKSKIEVPRDVRN